MRKTRSVSSVAIESELAEFADLANRSHRTSTAMNTGIIRAKDRYHTRLAEIDERALALGQSVANWASTNRKRAFGDRRSLDLPHAVIGWHNGRKTIEPAKGVSEEEVIMMLHGAAHDEYVRHVVSINREAILADLRAKAITLADLAAMGIRVTTRERFYINPKIGGKAMSIRWTVKRALPSAVYTLEDAQQDDLPKQNTKNTPRKRKDAVSAVDASIDTPCATPASEALKTASTSVPRKRKARKVEAVAEAPTPIRRRTRRSKEG